ncbi:MAG: hypothetical protein M0Q95_01950 [Porticoccaceae bacterium]|nr:hypothetical protein [Porticoccaceae bacterium]
MTPGFDVRLSSMKRALSEVIIPAIDSDSSLAQEQAALLLGHLELISQQWRNVSRYNQICLDEIMALVKQIKPVGKEATQSASLQLNEAMTAATGDSEAAYKQIAHALEQLVYAVDIDGDGDFRDSLHRQILLYSQQQALRDRVWFAACGFDVNAKALPSIDEIISGQKETNHG